MRILFAAIACFWAFGAHAEEPIDKLAYFDRYVGKTFSGTMQNATEPTVDVQKWESTMGGKAIRITHSINNGVYGGETLVYVDARTTDLSYVYVTTAGFRTEGTFDVTPDGRWSAEEDVKGHETIAKVRSSGYIDEAGRLISSSTYINKDGSEVPGHQFVYEETPNAQLVF